MFDRKMKFNQAGTGVLEIKDNTRAKNIIEAKLGLQANINKNLKIWGQLNGQWGQHGYNQYGTHAGVSYFW